MSKTVILETFQKGVEIGYDMAYGAAYALGKAEAWKTAEHTYTHNNQEKIDKACKIAFESGRIAGVNEYLARMEKIRTTAPVIKPAPAKKRGRPAKLKESNESC